MFFVFFDKDFFVYLFLWTLEPSVPTVERGDFGVVMCFVGYSISITNVRHRYSTPAGLMILALGALPKRSSSASCFEIQRLKVVVDTPAARANSHLYIAFIRG